MNYFLDTEFGEYGTASPPTIELISIGLVAEDGREYYAESFEFDPNRCNGWVKQNVLPLLGPEDKRLPRSTIRNQIVEFVGKDMHPMFWAYFADYDWVVFCWLFGSMLDLPPHFPMLCMDLKQWMVQLGAPDTVKPDKSEAEHNALEDARWNLRLHRRLGQYAEGQG